MTSISIIGGGIGGAAAALSLLKAGFDVQVYERSGGDGEVGAGFQLSPNATKLLIRLGLGEQLASFGVRGAGSRQRRWQDGRTVVWTPFADVVEEMFGAPHYTVHRADVLRMLIDALPPDRVHFDHALAGFTDHGDRVEAEFTNGARAEADILIGADGIHSTVRRQLFGRERPRFTNCAAYRGLIPEERIRHLDIPHETQLWMGPGCHLVHYFVRGGALLNFVANVEQDAWSAESWTEEGDKADALAAYEGWHPQARGVLEAIDKTFIWAIFDRLPLERWSVGRVSLLGDACHPMQPHFAQGAVQAIEDGAALAACLAEGAGREPADVLAIYQDLRLPRTARVQGMAGGNKDRFHLPDGPAQRARDAEMAKNVTDWSVSAIGWLYGHDAGALDADTLARLRG